MSGSSSNSHDHYTGPRWQSLRRHIMIGGWIGNLVFILVGVRFGFYIGGYGGAKFFEELFLIDLTGPVASLLGSVVGVFVGVISTWAILVICFSFFSSLVYLLVHHSFPSPYE